MSKTALILGGTKGLGLALAWDAHYLKYNPVIAGRSVHDKDTNKKFPPDLTDSSLLQVDLIDPNFIVNAMDFVEKIWGLRFDYIFWVSGILIEKPFRDFTSEEIMEMIRIHYAGPIEFLRQLTNFQIRYQKPFHLVTISSTSSWRVRDNQASYCSLQAAKSAFTMNFAREIARDLPGSKTTLIHPGGMKTELFKETKTDTSNFMDPKVVSRIIWNEVVSQKVPFHEVQIMRNDDGTPNVSYGPRLPEIPFKE